MNKISAFFEKNRWAFPLALAVVSLSSFFIILIPREVVFLKTVGVIIRYNTPRLLFVGTILLLISLYIKKTRLSLLLTSLIIFPIFSFTLVGLWASAYTETNVITGILPRMDALSFFSSSLALLEKGYLVGYTQRRPLFSGFFAFFLWVAKGNIQITMAATVFITAVVTYFSVIEVSRALNPPSAVIFFFPQFFYIRRYIGSILSENLGYILGMAAFTLFLIALRKKQERQKGSIPIFLFAVFLFTLAQVARPGAIATLPFLIVFAGWLWKGKQKISWKILMITTLTITAGFLVNSYLFSQITQKNSNQLNNVGYGIYGVVSGGNSWGQLVIDYPELNHLEPGIREKRITEIIILEVLNRPENFVKGMLHQFSIIFSLRPIYNYNVFSSMLSRNLLLNYVLVCSYYLFSLVGIGYCIFWRKKPLFGFSLVLLVGFLFSLPLSPAYQTQYMRYYAASTSFLGIHPAVGFSLIIQFAAKKFKFLKENQKSDDYQVSGLNIIFTILLTIIVLGGPLLIKAIAPKKELISSGCPDGESEVIINYYPGSSVSIIPFGFTWIPNISEEDYRRSIINIPTQEIIDYFDNIAVPNTIFATINLLDDNSLYVVTKFDKLPMKKTALHACGIIEDVYGEPADTGFFYPNTIEEYTY